LLLKVLNVELLEILEVFGAVVETDHGKLATGRQVSRCLVTVRAVSSEASVPVIVLTTGSPPQSSDLTQGALIQWVNDASLEGNGS
jgi:hypothetical protein